MKLKSLAIMASAFIGTAGMAVAQDTTQAKCGSGSCGKKEVKAEKKDAACGAGSCAKKEKKKIEKKDAACGAACAKKEAKKQ